MGELSHTAEPNQSLPPLLRLRRLPCALLLSSSISREKGHATAVDDAREAVLVRGQQVRIVRVLRQRADHTNRRRGTGRQARGLLRGRATLTACRVTAVRHRCCFVAARTGGRRRVDRRWCDRSCRVLRSRWRWLCHRLRRFRRFRRFHRLLCRRGFCRFYRLLLLRLLRRCRRCRRVCRLLLYRCRFRRYRRLTLCRRRRRFRRLILSHRLHRLRLLRRRLHRLALRLRQRPL
mmetsp:Transcript_41184/g.102457  ORF Transcript_41184/g.102457 Transcript_41184/m.102457 type:complete len:234 (+) Transcript_41184:145-846(+)